MNRKEGNAMNLEEEIFRKSVLLYDKLIPFGFQMENGCYTISKNILKDSFQMIVTVSKENNITGKIIDLEFKEEYTNFRLKDQKGEFVNRVREEFINFLKEIKLYCTSTNLFLYDQTNRITKEILKIYQNDSEFLWEKAPGYGVFRNPQNKKWYAIIMNIKKDYIDKGDEEVEILNVKLPKEEIEELLKRNGFYEAYHMNKKNWITILLDDTLEDGKILEYIKKSHHLTEK